MTTEKIIINQTSNNVVVSEIPNKVLITSPGAQGPRGKTILNGAGSPSNNLGLEGDFYYDTATTRFYGPKLSDITWAGAINYILDNPAGDYSMQYSWELNQVTGPVQGLYSIEIQHNLGFAPNVTIKTSSGDVLETGIDYNSNNKITLIMAQPFSGTAYLS